MKKIKWTFMTLAIVLGIGGAFATSLHQDCQAAIHYFYTGTWYAPAGRIGIDYICVTPSSSVYTYYKVVNTYVPCMYGFYCTPGCEGPLLHSKNKK